MTGGRLEEELGPGAFRVLDQWSRQKGFVHEFDKRLISGLSGAVVLVVDRHDQHGPSRKLILKLDSVTGTDFTKTEYARHRLAAAEGDAFSANRLARLENDPLPVGSEQWITFQRIAGNDLGEFSPVSSLLSGFVDDSDDQIEADVFGRVMGAVVSGLLVEWNTGPRITQMSVADFLRCNLGDRLAPGLPLYERMRTAGSVRLPNGLPDPYALLADNPLTAGHTVKAALGRCHGDLHVENILVRTWPELDPADFQLVDLAKYDSRGPLTRDPVHLLLHMIARSMHSLGSNKRTLADVLIDPNSGRADQLPGWLRRAITGVFEAENTWIREFSYGSDWRRQRLLSMTACALVIHHRKSTRAEDREWFLNLGARAAAAFLGDTPPAVPLRAEAPAQSARESAEEESATGPPPEALRRHALVIGVDTFDDAEFRRLKAPAADITELGGVLADPDRGGFDVAVLANPGQREMATRVEAFFGKAAPGDFLLLYFSGHGVKDVDGRFFLTASDSRIDLLGSTCLPGDVVRDWMNRSLSKKIVVILDCCYAGAFPMTARSSAPGLDVLNDLGGRGRAVLTATTGYAYSFESEAEATTSTPSVFTGMLVDGMLSGAADLDGDGWVEIGELYHYVRERVLPQTPMLKTDVEGPLYVSRAEVSGARRVWPRPTPAAPTAPAARIVVADPRSLPPAPARRRDGLQNLLVVAAVIAVLFAIPLALSGGTAWRVQYGAVSCPARRLPVLLTNETDKDGTFVVEVDGSPVQTVKVAPHQTEPATVVIQQSPRTSQVIVRGPDHEVKQSAHQAPC